MTFYKMTGTLIFFGLGFTFMAVLLSIMQTGSGYLGHIYYITPSLKESITVLTICSISGFVFALGAYWFAL